jgi:plastocyanin
MKRREFLEKAGIGSAALATLGGVARAESVTGAAHQHGTVDGPLANAVVSFGQWPTEPPLDRYPNIPPTPAQNVHVLAPFEARIKAGGAVMFVIAGLHHVLVYDDGTQPGDIDVNATNPTTGIPPGVPLINDPRRRLYRGVDPSLFPLDRTEAVSFPRPGRYLVICGVRPHFVNDGMFAYVDVIA